MSTKHQQSVADGSIIFREGDAGDCAYVIDSGRVLVYLTKDQEEIPISILGAGEIFGEMSLIDNLSRSASVRCIEDCVLTVITREQMLQRFQGSDGLVQLLLKVLMTRLRRNNLAISNQWDVVNGKKSGVANLYVDSSAKFGDVFENIKFENRLQDALHKGEFVMYYQPILNIQSDTVIGCEALIRWNDPIRGLIMPDSFIDFLENSALVVPVGFWILDRCFADFHQLKALGGPHFMMSINVSSRQFTHPEFVEELEKIAWKHRVPVQNIKLEVTERVMMEGAVALDTLARCHEKGYCISIDDFGTGFSSLKYLSQMPVNYLKVDRSFVMKVSRDAKALAVIRSIIFMAQSLGMDIIAEGIETIEERDILIRLGASFGQGWLYSKAVPLAQFLLLPHQFLVKKQDAA
jgi:EAL domain-containing protein (putative c-di-GMP-specific phosphodiesterase class I)/CRP-like cAMP-binding protein